MEKKYLELKNDWEMRHINRKIYNVYKGFLYHYTTRENLWNIINSDSFYARHVRFSNDSEEYFIGKKEIEEFCGKNISNVDDCYMICFCEKDDILSQWREYARGGVSLMLDFGELPSYTIKCNMKTENKNKNFRDKKEQSSYYIPSTLYSSEFNYYNEYAEPIKVKYINPGKKALKKDMEEIGKFIIEEMSRESAFKTLIPYIKHIGFKEEKEVRLIFDIDKNIAHYLVEYIDSDGIKKPNIRVEIGDASKKELNNCTVRTHGIPDEVLQNIKGGLKNGDLEITNDKKIQLVFKEEEKPISRKRKFPKSGYISIGSCKWQEQVFQYIDHFISDANILMVHPYRIWCEGHLPIRKITIGPSRDKEELRESIEHKIRNIYWMKYVKVCVSDIPYRSDK